MKKEQSKLLTIVSVIALLVGSSTGFLGGFLAASINKGDDDGISGLVKQDVQVVEEESAIIDAAETASDSVVSVVVSKDVTVFDEYFFNPYSDDPFGYFNDEDLETEEKQVSAGTGFIVTGDGLVVTNRHVIDTQDANYAVYLNDGTRLEAKLLEADTLLDIALLQIDSDQEFKPLDLGASSELKVGQRVIAIGNALGQFSNSVSSGIVSSLSRDITAVGSESTIEDLIQTDAAINPGNSGGPLLDINGNVVGVNVAVADAENIGFAIKIDVVKDLLERFESTGSIARPVLGVRYRTITSEYAEQEDIVVDYGALIVGSNRRSEVGIVPGSPAEEADLEVGDIILEIDGVKLDEDNSLAEVIQNKFYGDEIEIKFLREGEEKNVNVELFQIEE